MLKLRGVTFTSLIEKEKNIGVIAQEIASVIPYVVRTSNDGMMSVAYGNLTALLIEAVKEQNKRIDELEKRINKNQS